MGMAELDGCEGEGGDGRAGWMCTFFSNNVLNRVS